MANNYFRRYVKSDLRVTQFMVLFSLVANQSETDMTDTRFFSATAIDRATGRARTFWSFRPYHAGVAARKWLRNLR